MRQPCQTVITTAVLIWSIFCNGGVRSEDECPETCPEVYEPVCGTDGHLYPNECELRKSNCYIDPPVSVGYEGFCRTEWDIHLSTNNTNGSNTDGSVFLAIYDYDGRNTKPLSIGSPKMQKKNFTFVTIKMGKTKLIRVWFTGAAKVYLHKIYIMQDGSGVWSVYRMRRWLGIGKNKEIYMNTGLTAVATPRAVPWCRLTCNFKQNATICASSGVEYFNECFLRVGTVARG